MSRGCEFDLADLSCLSRGLRSQSLGRLRDSAAMRSVPAKTLLFKQGEAPSHLYLVRRGYLKLFHLSVGGTPIGLGFATAGDPPVGAAAVLRQAPHSASAYAVSDASVVGWTRAQFEAIAAEDPALLWNVLPALCAQSDALMTQLREFVTEPVEQRIAHALLRIMRVCGDGMPARTPPVSRQDIAELTGTTHFTASRILKDWQRQGIITNERPRILIHDTRRLKDIAEGTRTEARPCRPEIAGAPGGLQLLSRGRPTIGP